MAEEFHRNMLLQNGVFRPEEEVILGRPFPDAPAVAGVCIDDLAVVQKLSASQAKSHAVLRDNKILQAADQVYDSHRLPEKVSKRQRLLNGGRAWGAFLSDRVNAGDEKTGELTKLTFAAVMTGYMRKREAQKIAGHLNYPLQFDLYMSFTVIIS